MIYVYKNIYKYLFILLFVLISEILPQGKIIGVVRDLNYLVPVSGAEVMLTQDGKEKIFLNQNTDGTGFFAFNDIPYEIFQIEVKLKGYSGYRIKNIVLSSKQSFFNFDTIKISSKLSGITEIVLKSDFPESEIKTAKNDDLKISYGNIIGTVRDKRDYTPIKDAVVYLFKNIDSIRISGTGTDGTGFFTFNDLPLGKYRIEVSYTGYSVYKTGDIILDKNKPNVNVDTIKLFSGNYRTDEILVQDEKPLMEFNDDKKVFNVDNIMTSKGGTAIDVLRKLPMVEVDAQDNISLRGSKNLLILIDNKPMRFSSLRQLPADAIKNVEVITNPSAKYEAEGVTGILNIVLKKIESNSLGYNGNLYSGYRNNSSYNTGLGLNMKKNRWSFFLNGGTGDFRYKSNNTSEVTYYQPSSFYNSNSDGNGNSKYYYGGFGLEYEVKKNHNLGFDTYYNKSSYNSSSLSHSYNYNSNHLLSSLYNNNYSGNGDIDNIYAGLYYNGKFGKLGKELNFDATFSRMNNKFDASQNIVYFDSLYRPVNTPSLQLNSNSDKSLNFRIQLDYSNPFNDNTKFETGYKGIFRSNDNEYNFDTLNYSSNNYVKNTDLTNHFKLSDNINAVYGTFSHNIKKFRFKLGLRIEHTYTKGELITYNTEFTKNYLDVFPTISFSQKLGLSHELQLSYSRRITRPLMYRLNPFIRKSNAKFISYGNPELEPEYTNSFEFSYVFYSNAVSITPVGFYRKSNNVISSYSYVTDSNVTATSYRNSSSGYSYGMDLIISSRALKWWNINSTFSFYNSKYEDNLATEYSSEEGFSWKANIRSFFTFSGLFNLEIYYDYTGKRINSNGFNQPSQSLDISVNKSFFKNKLTIGIRGEDLFKTRKWGSEINGTGVKSVYDYGWDSRGVFLNISYNFGNSDKYYKKSRNTKKNENEKSDVNEEGNK